MMDVETESTGTSVEETSENLCDNPTRDTLAEGLMGLLKPTVDRLDERVRATRSIPFFSFSFVFVGLV